MSVSRSPVAILIRNVKMGSESDQPRRDTHYGERDDSLLDSMCEMHSGCVVLSGLVADLIPARFRGASLLGRYGAPHADVMTKVSGTPDVHESGTNRWWQVVLDRSGAGHIVRLRAGYHVRPVIPGWSSSAPIRAGVAGRQARTREPGLEHSVPYHDPS